MDYLTVQEFQDSIEVIKEQLTVRDNPEFYYVVQGDGGQIIYKTDLIPGEGGDGGGEYNGPFAVTAKADLKVDIIQGFAELSQSQIGFLDKEDEDLSSQITTEGSKYLYYRIYGSVDSPTTPTSDIKVTSGFQYPDREFVEIQEGVSRWVYPLVLAEIKIEDVSDEGEPEDLQITSVLQLQYGSHQVAGVFS